MPAYAALSGWTAVSRHVATAASTSAASRRPGGIGGRPRRDGADHGGREPPAGRHRAAAQAPGDPDREQDEPERDERPVAVQAGLRIDGQDRDEDDRERDVADDAQGARRALAGAADRWQLAELHGTER